MFRISSTLGRVCFVCNGASLVSWSHTEYLLLKKGSEVSPVSFCPRMGAMADAGAVSKPHETERRSLYLGIRKRLRQCSSATNHGFVSKSLINPLISLMLLLSDKAKGEESPRECSSGSVSTVGDEYNGMRCGLVGGERRTAGRLRRTPPATFQWPVFAWLPSGRYGICA
ncbi:hypothetical protein BASA61_008657 [Batrachochytrium salamandrivorans]|nr:hypothetical protein BASA61_008657 [Batrachochytrium salamandrivorans]